jgi:sugar lactone lactonase YvrE
MSRRTLAATALAVAAVLGPAGVASAAEPPVSHARILAHFDVTAGEQPENLLVEPAGVDLVFARSHQVVRIDHGRRQVLTTLPAPADGGVHTPRIGFAIATGIARGADGSYYVGYAAGSDDLTGVWRFRPGHQPARVIPLTAASFPNGLAIDPHTGDIYVADSSLGVVWRARPGGGTPAAWSTAPELAATTLFGANGLKVHNGAVWVSNLDRGTLVRIPLNGGRAQVRFTGAPGIDDFTFVGDTVLAANNGVNQVVLIRPNGSASTVLTAADGLREPTAVAVDGKAVYVTSAAYGSRTDPNLLVAHLDGRS